MAIPPPPPGFTLNATAGAVPPPPPGFTLNSQASSAPPALPSASVAGPQVGAGEAALNIGTGMIAAPAAGIAGLAQGVKNLIPGMQGMPAADRVAQVQNSMTYQPRTAEGQAVTGTVTYPLRKLASFADAAGDMTSRPIANLERPNQPALIKPLPGRVPITRAEANTPTPLAGALVNTGIQAAPALFTRGRAAPAEAAAEVAKPVTAATPSEAALAAGKQLGLKFTPSQEGRLVGSVIEGLAGAAKLERSISKQNAKVVNAASAREIGLPEGVPITRQTIAQARQAPNKVYDEVSRLGQVATDDSWRAEIANIGDRSGNKSFAEDTPADIQKLKDIYTNKQGFDAGDAVQKVRSLRSNGFANIGLREPEKQALGRAQLDIANALDNQLERHAQSLGQNDLVQRYQDARAQLATIHVVRRALKGSDVSAQRLSAQQERGVTLPGDLKTIADAYDAADRSLQNAGKIRDNSPFSVVDLFVGAGAGLHNPALATAALARPIARAALASEAYQRRGPASPPPKPLKPVGSNALRVGPPQSATAVPQPRTKLSDLVSQRR